MLQVAFDGLKACVIGNSSGFQIHNIDRLPRGPNASRAQVAHMSALKGHFIDVTPFHNTPSYKTRWEQKYTHECVGVNTMDSIYFKRMDTKLSIYKNWTNKHLNVAILGVEDIATIKTMARFSQCPIYCDQFIGKIIGRKMWQVKI